jgi:hypothetical protein
MADEEMPEVDASLVVSAYDWGALGDVVDVGGGDGTLLIALLNEYRALRGTVVDLPATAETARKMFTAAGLADRGSAVAGDFFNTLPPGAEGYLLCSVLHRWDDERARAILRNCATAAGEDGAVFVIEKTAAATTTDPASTGVAAATAAGSPGAPTAASTDLTTAGSAGAETADQAGVGSASRGRSDSPGLLLVGGGPDHAGERARDVGELTVLAESAGLAVAAVHTADTVAIIELAVR